MPMPYEKRSERVKPWRCLALRALVLAGLGALVMAGAGAGIGCGGSAKRTAGDDARPATRASKKNGNRARPAAGPPPVDISVRVTRRFGTLVRLDVKGIARGRPAKEAFENPRQWNVTAMSGDHMLTRAVNGPARIVRDPVGSASSDLWDVEVTFWVAFNVPEEASSMVVRVIAPASPVYETTLDLGWGTMDEEEGGGTENDKGGGGGKATGKDGKDSGKANRSKPARSKARR